MSENTPRSELEKVFRWLFSRDTGMSSKAIAGHMVCGVSDGSYPHDPADFGRCLRLLEQFPHWVERIPEMARYGNVWAAYSVRWDEMTRLMDEEVGIHPKHLARAPKTYALMQEIRESVRAAA